MQKNSKSIQVEKPLISSLSLTRIFCKFGYFKTGRNASSMVKQFFAKCPCNDSIVYNSS